MHLMQNKRDTTDPVKMKCRTIANKNTPSLLISSWVKFMESSPTYCHLRKPRTCIL